jgi:hypothetical protein
MSGQKAIHPRDESELPTASTLGTLETSKPVG